MSKLLEVLALRELADLISASSKPRVILNCLTPGFCHSDIIRETTAVQAVGRWILKFLLARSTELGSRTLVASAEAGDESHGQYMADCEVAR